MNIQGWHYGKLIMLWAWGGMISLIILNKLETNPKTFWGLLLIGLLGLIPLVLSVITWTWLSGKEK